MLCATIILSILLPKKWFYDVFVARGAALVISGLGYIMLVAYQFKSKEHYPSLFLKPWSLALASGVILLLVFLAGRIAVLRKAIEFFADRVTVFLYITIPLSIISVFMILILATI